MTLLGVISFLNIFFAVCLILSPCRLRESEFISVGRVVLVFVIRTHSSVAVMCCMRVSKAFRLAIKKELISSPSLLFLPRSYFSRPAAEILSTIEFPRMKSLQLFISTWPAFTWFLLPTHSTCKFSCYLFISSWSIQSHSVAGCWSWQWTSHDYVSKVINPPRRLSTGFVIGRS